MYTHWTRAAWLLAVLAVATSAAAEERSRGATRVAHSQPENMVYGEEYIPTDGEMIIYGGEYVGEPRRGIIPTVRAAMFRLYGGPVEMQTKTYYPPGYYGNYYFEPWRPIWIRDYPAPRPALDVDRYWHDPFFAGPGTPEGPISAPTAEGEDSNAPLIPPPQTEP